MVSKSTNSLLSVRAEVRAGKVRAGEVRAGEVMQALCDLTRLSAKAQEEPSSNSYSLSGGWSFYTLVSGREGYNYYITCYLGNITVQKRYGQHSLDVTLVMGYINTFSIASHKTTRY